MTMIYYQTSPASLLVQVHQLALYHPLFFRFLQLLLFPIPPCCWYQYLTLGVSWYFSTFHITLLLHYITLYLRSPFCYLYTIYSPCTINSHFWSINFIFNTLLLLVTYCITPTGISHTFHYIPPLFYRCLQFCGSLSLLPMVAYPWGILSSPGLPSIVGFIHLSSQD
ncbi:hypothetical protein AB205_0219890 [Aquarana catesbeiana]|uniref:Uncharacterized protein n=1 Tax=Aquarana catesbeiana TaxID=8400 RepID=A0A2G9SNX5_AQUCT|nr:hypothetical protein AB205_0219890 [Aquarana catesbeiana]